MSKEKTKRINIDYYAVVIEDGGSFTQILERINSMPNDQRRNFEIYGEFPTRLSRLEECKIGDVSILLGEVVKIQMNGLPMKARTTGETSEIDFADNEGVGQETWFLYDPDGGYLLLQRNRNGITAGAFETYFSSFLRSGGVKLEALISATAMERLRASSRISTFDVAVRPVLTSKDDLAQVSKAVGGAIAALDDVGGNVVAFQVGVGKGGQGKSLSLSGVINNVRKLLKRSADHGDVKKLKVVAEYDEEIGLDPIDFLRDRLGAWENIPYDESRRLRELSITGLLKKAWKHEDFQTIKQAEKKRQD